MEGIKLFKHKFIQEIDFSRKKVLLKFFMDFMIPNFFQKYDPDVNCCKFVNMN